MADSQTDELFLKFSKDPQALEEELKEIRVDTVDLVRTLAEHSSLYLKWARLVSKAKKEFAIQDRLINCVIFPEAREYARQILRAANEKSTEARLDEMAYADKAYLSAAEIRGDLEALVDTFKNAEEAFRQRLETIKSISFRQNNEMKTL